MLAVVFTSATSVSAASRPRWDLRNTYTVDFTCTLNCSGTTSHTMVINTENFVTGDFSGTGVKNGDPSVTWTITGNQQSYDVTFHILYTGVGAGYTIDGKGLVKPAGNLDGSATSSNNEKFKWLTTSGLAKLIDLDYQDQLKPANCGVAANAVPLIDVRQQVINDADSGITNYWAFDAYERHIRVWNTGGATHCALVQYNGTFDGVAGQTSPQGTGILSGDERGSMNGGYRDTFTGVLAQTDPANWPLKGTVKPNPFDYQCNILGVCPGRVDWLSKYFPGSSHNLVWWGWLYAGGNFGTWVNSIDMTAGDIIE